MRIGVPRETRDRETRVAATPTSVAGLTKLGWEVTVEAGAGERSSFSDDAYTEAGAEIGDPWSADVVLAINTPGPDELSRLTKGATLVCRVAPAQNADLLVRPRLAGDHGARHRRGAPHLAGAVARRAQLDGEHRGLPRGDRGRAPLRPVLHRPDHRGREGPAGEGARRRCRGRRARGDRRGVLARRRSSAPPIPGPRSRTRWVPSAGSTSRWSSRARRPRSPPTGTRRRPPRTTTGAPPRSTPSRPATSTSSSPRP